MRRRVYLTLSAHQTRSDLIAHSHTCRGSWAHGYIGHIGHIKAPSGEYPHLRYFRYAPADSCEPGLGCIPAAVDITSQPTGLEEKYNIDARAANGCLGHSGCMLLDC